MKKITFLLLFTLCANLIIGQHENHQVIDTAKTQTKPKSPKMQAMAMIGDNHVHIDFASPSVRGRSIWNGLVAFDQVWSSGAHKATSIEFGQDVMIQGVHVPKGKYGFFTIPGKATWTLILSKTWDMHLADEYKEENDLLRLTVMPNENKEFAESLTYDVKAINENEGRIILSWEKLNVSFDFANKK